MLTEDDWWNELASNPSSWHTRLIFADWLEEHGSPLAEGMRVLGQLELGSHYIYDLWWIDSELNNDTETSYHNKLPTIWYNELEDIIAKCTFYMYSNTIREVEIAIIQAYYKLTNEQKYYCTVSRGILNA